MKRKLIIVSVIILVITMLFVALYFIINDQIKADVEIQSKQGLEVFKKPIFDYVLADTVPNKSEIINPGKAVSVFAAQGEIEPITFSVRSSEDLGSVDVTISDLSSKTGERITKDNMELLNIRLWQQCKRNPDLARWNWDCSVRGKHIKEVVPELLVKDNEQDLIVAEQKSSTATKYIPPSVNQDFKVSIKKDKSHTFFIRVKVPEQTQPGIYKGKVNIKPKQALETSALTKEFSRTIDIEFQVLPFQLPESSKEHLVYFNQMPTGYYVDPLRIGRELYSKYLDLFRESGLTNIVAYINTSYQLDWVLDELQAKGFSKTFIIVSNNNNFDPEVLTKRASDIKEHGFDPYFYTIDEPNYGNKMLKNIVLVNRVHKTTDIKVATAIQRECVEAMADPDFPVYDGLDKVDIAQSMDLPNYAGTPNKSKGCCCGGVDKYQSFTEYINGLISGTTEKSSKKEFFYQQLWGESAKFNRAYFGYFLWNNKLDGVAPYGVQAHYNTIGGVEHHGKYVIDDFDAKKKEHNSLYPSAEGPILTLQWEAFREGIDDVRYLTYYDQLLNQLEDQDQVYAQQLRTELDKEIRNYNFGTDDSRSPWKKEVSDATYQATREYVVEKILKVSELLTDPIQVDEEQDIIPTKKQVNQSQQDFEELVRTGPSSQNNIWWWLVGILAVITGLGILFIKIGQKRFPTVGQY